jgi:hypothetical protein
MSTQFLIAETMGLFQFDRLIFFELAGATSGWEKGEKTEKYSLTRLRVG